MSKEAALEILKPMILAIENSDIRLFREALEAYTAYLEHLRRNEIDNPAFTTVRDEMSLDPINTQVASILPDDCEDELDGSLAENYSAPIFMAVDKLVQMGEHESRRAFQAHLQFIQSLIQELHANVNLLISGCVYHRSLLTHFIMRSERLSPNKCRVILFFLIDMGGFIHEADSNQDFMGCPLTASVWDGNEICFHLLREKNVHFWRGEYNPRWDLLISARKFSIVIALIEQREELHVHIFNPPLEREDNILHALAHLFDIRRMENEGYVSFRKKKSIQEDMAITKDILQSVDPAVLRALLHSRNGENRTPEELLIYDILPPIQLRVKAMDADIADIHATIRDNKCNRRMEYRQLERLEAIKASLIEAHGSALQCLQLLGSIDPDPNFENRLAFAMGQSKGVGKDSLTHRLSSETMQQILRFLRP